MELTLQPDDGVEDLLALLAERLGASGGVPGLFRRLDRNRSGFLEEDEFAECVLRHVGGATPVRAIQAMFDRLDTNGDGGISESELAAFMREAEPDADPSAEEAATERLEEHVAALSAQLETTRRESDRLGRALAAQVAKGSSPSPRKGSDSPVVAERRRQLAKQHQLLQLRRQRMQFAERQLQEQVLNEQLRTAGSASPRSAPALDDAPSPEEAAGFRPAVSSSPRVVTPADQPSRSLAAAEGAVLQPDTAVAPPPTDAPPPRKAAPRARVAEETPAVAAEPGAAEAARLFAQYDLNGDGVLDKAEVAGMVASLDYEADAAYLDSVMTTFGNAAGVIEQADFDGVWEFFGGGESYSAPVTVPAGRPEDAALLENFRTYDLNSSGALSLSEVQRMMQDLGYQADSVKPAIFASSLPEQQIVHYVNSVFSDFDQDGSGSITFEEFRKLWEHLSGDQAKAAAAAGGMTPRTRTMVEEADQSDPLVQQFRAADLNNDGKLSQYEVKMMMTTTLGYDVEESYVSDLLQLFGDFDLDSDGAISLDEFGMLFEHLGGHERVAYTAKHSDPLMAKFLVYDTESKGYLTKEDVLVIMADLNYDCDEEYLNGILSMFGSLDADNSGMLEFNEFKRLWSHLGADQTGDVPAPAGAEDHPLWAPFCQYDLNRDGKLSQYEIHQMMLALGYDATEDYVEQMVQTLGSFDQDGSGAVEFDEFPALWTHLGGDQASVAAAAGGMTPGTRTMVEEADQSDPLVQQFRAADLNNDGKLSQYEIQRMMTTTLGYDVEASYVSDLLQLFGDFDLDSDGAISLDEFGMLFEHLGGHERVAYAAQLAAEEAEEEDEPPEVPSPSSDGGTGAEDEAAVIVSVEVAGPFGVAFDEIKDSSGSQLRVANVVPTGSVAKQLSGVALKSGAVLTSVNGKWIKSSKQGLKKLRLNERPITLGFNETVAGFRRRSAGIAEPARQQEQRASTAFEPVDPLAARFREFDGGKGSLAPADVSAVVEALGYDATEEYMVR